MRAPKSQSRRRCRRLLLRLRAHRRRVCPPCGRFRPRVRWRHRVGRRFLGLSRYRGASVVGMKEARRRNQRGRSLRVRRRGRRVRRKRRATHPWLWCRCNSARCDRSLPYRPLRRRLRRRHHPRPASWINRRHAYPRNRSLSPGRCRSRPRRCRMLKSPIVLSHRWSRRLMRRSACRPRVRPRESAPHPNQSLQLDQRPRSRRASLHRPI